MENEPTPAKTKALVDDADIEPLFVTIKTASRITGLGPTMLYEMLSVGAIKGFKIGNRRLLDYQSLKKLAR